MSAFTIHYAGALEWRSGRGQVGVTTVAAGFAACCTGQRAEKIRAARAHTYETDEVTCLACQKNMTRAGLLRRSRPERWPLLPKEMREKLARIESLPYSVREAADDAEMMLARLAEQLAAECRHCRAKVSVGSNCCPGCAAKKNY